MMDETCGSDPRLRSHAHEWPLREVHAKFLKRSNPAEVLACAEFLEAEI